MHAKLLQSCLILCNPVNCSLPGSSVHGDSPGKYTGVGCHSLLQGIFLTEGSTSHLQHWQVGSLPLVPPGKSTLPPTKFLHWDIKNQSCSEPLKCINCGFTMVSVLYQIVYCIIIVSHLYCELDPHRYLVCCWLSILFHWSYWFSSLLYLSMTPSPKLIHCVWGVTAWANKHSWMRRFLYFSCPSKAWCMFSFPVWSHRCPFLRDSPESSEVPDEVSCQPLTQFVFTSGQGWLPGYEKSVTIRVLRKEWVSFAGCKFPVILSPQTHPLLPLTFSIATQRLHSPQDYLISSLAGSFV